MWAIGCIMGELIDGQPLFPGESEIDQLYIIQKIIGPLTPLQKEMFSKNPRFLGLKFPDMTKPETLDKRYMGKLSKRALMFMRSLLRMDASETCTAQEALQNPYFEGLRERDQEKIDLMRNALSSAHSNKNSRMRNPVGKKDSVGSNSPQDMKKMSNKMQQKAVKDTHEMTGVAHGNTHYNN